MLHSRALIVLMTVLIILMVDVRFAAIVKRATVRWHLIWRRCILGLLVWIPGLLAATSIALYYYASEMGLHLGINQWVMTILTLAYFIKAGPVLISVMEDLWRGVLSVKRWSVRPPAQAVPEDRKISRSEFLAKTSLAVAGLPLAGGVFAIGYGAYDFRGVRQVLCLPNLPSAFDGLRIGQISDLHLNAAYFDSPFGHGIELLVAEKPDVIFFTGDLVNYRTSEASGYVSLLKGLRAPLGVFSVTGNHDYGDYVSWPTHAAKEKNFNDFIDLHKMLGYQLLLNEHRIIRINGEEIAILGVENWGKGRFHKYGDLAATVEGTSELPVRLLLSHDPSHWNIQVRQKYPSIDVTFAGHTHGFQFGIESDSFRWSPAQYVYEQWAGLYRSNEQYIYVNRGYGSLGFLGRLGIRPELTIIELKRGSHGQNQPRAGHH